MMIAPGKQGLTRRRAQRGGVEVGELHALGRQPIHGGRGDLGAVAAEAAEAQSGHTGKNG